MDELETWEVEIDERRENMRELEFKFKLKDRNAFFEKLKQKGVIFSETVEQNDIIFFRKGKNFSDLEDGEPVIRIRQEQDKAKVTIKKYISGIMDREEIEYEILDVSAFRKFLNLMNCNPIVSVKKTRMKGMYHETVVTIDSVIGLGDYVELEILSSAKDVDDNWKKLNSIVENLELDMDDLVRIPYDQMLYMRGEKYD